MNLNQQIPIGYLLNKKMKKYTVVLSIIFGCIFTQTSFAQINNLEDFKSKLSSFYQIHTEDGLVKYELIKKDNQPLFDLIYFTEKSINTNENVLQGLKIHAYNLNAIRIILENYPVKSPKAIAGFFDSQITFNAQPYSLQSLEDEVIKVDGLADAHFAMVCAAMSCPPLRHFDIDNTTASIKSMKQDLYSDPQWVGINETSKVLTLSRIFQWYEDDFGGIEAILEALGDYNNTDLSSYTVQYKGYNWGLNQYTAQNGDQLLRYRPSALLEKGEAEIKLFANYYTQSIVSGTEPRLRQSFFTNTFSATFGLNIPINIGIRGRYRTVDVGSTDETNYFSGLLFKNDFERYNRYSRIGFAGVGPAIQHAMVFKNTTFLFIHTVLFPTGSNLEGDNESGYFDWNGLQWTSQVYFDKDIGSKFNIFYDFSVFAENIRGATFNNEPIFYQIGNGNTVILNYFPVNKVTLYGLLNLTILRYGVNQNETERDFIFSPFGQLGFGAKYFISPQIELEFIGTLFNFQTETQNAQTLNFGIRYRN